MGAVEKAWADSSILDNNYSVRELPFGIMLLALPNVVCVCVCVCVSVCVRVCVCDSCGWVGVSGPEGLGQFG